MISRRCAAVLVALALFAPLPARAQSTPGPSTGAAAEGVRVLQVLEDAFAAVAERAMPSVVNVSAKPRKGAAESSGGAPPEAEQRFREFFGQEFFDRFFRRRGPRDEGRAAGSGVIVDARGYILTNHHVVENAGEI